MQRYALIALVAAALFGASTPIAKILLGSTGPVTLAGLLYLGAGLGLLLARVLGLGSTEARLRSRDIPWLAAAVACGGVGGPLLLLWGLSGTPASSASLLLGFEGVLTALIAAVAFREAVAGRVWLGFIVMVVAAGLLATRENAAFGASLPALAVLGACLMWAVDNNLTRRISTADPYAITTVKGIAAGMVNLALAAAISEPMPPAVSIGAALVLGVMSYGASLVLFIRALRELGAARATAHFGTAPFFGALLSVVILGEPVTAAFAAALALMAVATVLVLTETHEHRHAHERMVHSHVHSSDAHHTHPHPAGEAPEPHAHEHVHEPMTHSHPHLPDVHHRHRHGL